MDIGVNSGRSCRALCSSSIETQAILYEGSTSRFVNGLRMYVLGKNDIDPDWLYAKGIEGTRFGY